jgi:hypothetical protein
MTQQRLPVSYGVWVAWALAAVLAAAPADAATPQRHSGQVIGFDPQAQVITLEEMERWTGPGTRPTRRSFEIVSSTRAEAVARSVQALADDWPGGFTVSALTVSDLRVGDYATVTVEHRDRRPIARSITIVRLG